MVSRQTTGLSVLSSLQHVNLTQALEGNQFHFDPPFALVSLSLDVAVVGEEDELEEDVGGAISCFEGVIEVEG